MRLREDNTDIPFSYGVAKLKCLPKRYIHASRPNISGYTAAFLVNSKHIVFTTCCNTGLFNRAFLGQLINIPEVFLGQKVNILSSLTS